MNRRSFFKLSAKVAAAAVIAPKVLAEALPVEAPIKVYGFADLQGTVTSVEWASYPLPYYESTVAGMIRVMRNLLGYHFDICENLENHSIEVTVPTYLHPAAIDIIFKSLDEHRPAGVSLNFKRDWWDMREAIDEGYIEVPEGFGK